MMEPADSFNLTLRGYQKQALKCVIPSVFFNKYQLEVSWMFSVEHGKNDCQRAASIHPLWSQYVFSFFPPASLIDLSRFQICVSSRTQF